MSKKSGLSAAERAVYDLVIAGVITEAHGAVYPRQLAGLSDAGLVRLRAGRYEPVRGAAAPEPPEIMVSLVVRIPADLMARLDALEAPTRSHAAREALTRGLDALARAKKARGAARPRGRRVNAGIEK